MLLTGVDWPIRSVRCWLRWRFNRRAAQIDRRPQGWRRLLRQSLPGRCLMLMTRVLRRSWPSIWTSMLRLAEFEELARSAGAEVAATLIQRRPKPDPATLVGQGKLEEIEAVIASTGADLVLFDHDLTPSQLRNLEAKLPCRVIDRTQLILDIFARHARTREGQLQVELAQLEYQLPRLAGRGKAMSQLGGGIGTRGPGETQWRRIAGRSICASIM